MRIKKPKKNNLGNLGGVLTDDGKENAQIRDRRKSPERMLPDEDVQRDIRSKKIRPRAMSAKRWANEKKKAGVKE